ncbi:DUF4465 domain-containing protein [Luteolibacter ambystomatis]|uniref:DUF4465 domain-containing protein n=1 Tax=Luteolibacter ambystomatis TaxID=2824561 RepID=A0A975G923_9BACT|nr:DUF4465 domain-containing protein [Luteolibacter ambystomatis]QUE51021.1 DUF4465 domain-containing protein [Luteolibacter ambystomatis]
MNRNALVVLALAGASLPLARAATLITTFESPGLATESNVHDSAYTDTANQVTFHNTYNSSFDSWSGFARSNTTDTTTPGFGNQYSSIAGGGSGGSATYGVGYYSAYDPQPTIIFDGYRGFVESIDLTNITYAALSMQDGDAFAKKFGGVDGTDPDYLLLTISGYAGDALTGTVNFYLADFRSSNSAEDYIVTDWRTLDLSSLGWVNELRFSMTSSDVGAFGINTPTYFAVDNLQFVPEPSTAVLAFAGLAPLLRRKRAC